VLATLRRLLSSPRVKGQDETQRAHPGVNKVENRPERWPEASRKVIKVSYVRVGKELPGNLTGVKKCQKLIKLRKREKREKLTEC